MYNSLKKLLDSLKCPICKSQIDICNFTDFKMRNYSKYNFSCALNNLHYSFYVPNIDHMLNSSYSSLSSTSPIQYERIILNHNLSQFEIIQNYSTFLESTLESTQENTNILIKSIDPEGRVLDLLRSFNYNKILFDFQQTDQNKIINRINTILTFH